MKSAIRLAAAVSTVALVTAACASGGTAKPSTSQPVSPRSSATITEPSPVASVPQLVVLAHGAAGSTSLWSLDTSGRWVALGATPNATALGRTPDGIAVVTAHEVDFRPISDLTHGGRLTTLKWSAAAPAAPVVSLDSSPAGRLAIATADEHSLGYGLVDTDGNVVAMAPAPTQSFTPLVAWLDETRLLALSTDNQQVSRLAVVNVAMHSVETSTAVIGITVFGVSSDGRSVAVATESTVYEGPVASLLSGTQPQQIVTLADSQIVWALSMDAAGTKVFMLSGTEAADGTVSSFHELGYARQGTSWVKIFDVAAPFETAISQVCLT